MKRRIVAVVLSLALCMGGTLEAGAAALGTPEVQAVVETESGSAGDSFSDEAEQQPQPDETPGESTGIEVMPEITETPDVTETPDSTVTPEVTETPDITEIPEITETPDADQADDFNAGDAEELQITSADGEDQKAVDNGNTDVASSTGAELVNGIVEATVSDWASDDLGYRLRKKKVSDDMVPEGKTSTDSTEAQQAAETEIEDVTENSAAETEVSEEDAAQTGDAAQDNDASAADAGSVEDNYFTAQDGLLQIRTNGHTGYYLFNEDGYLVTGRMTRKPGTAGYTGTQTVEWYFMESSKATLYSDSKDKAITPWTSNMGQQQKKYWLWTGSTFRYYADKTGNFKSVTDLKKIGKLQKIGSDYYTLDKNGKPYTGIKKLKAGSETFEYYFQPTKGTDGIPGKLFHSGWMYYKNSKGVKRFIYCSPKTATIGQVMKHGIYVSKVMSKTNTFLLSADGYVLKSTMAKAQDNAYYITDSKKGHVIKNKLVKYKGYRYYFGSNGKRATWKNSWHKCPGASNKYYYFGGVAGRVVEKTGWQKLTNSAGKYYGWFYFDKKGNHYQNQMITVKSSKKSYYFTSTGKVASGITKINNKYYFFATSNSKTHRGWMYKNTLIRYKNKWYYADSKGVLKKNGWQKVGKYWYYLKDYKVLTNQAIKRGKVNGRLDNQGRFTTGWVVISDYNNKVKYIDPSTGNKYLTNTSCWINGKLYYFDKNGYRRNDISSIYKGPYYVEVDRINGVMTVYTNSSKTIPVKTIRVSVGLSGTPTWTGTYTLRSSLRWQPLMGPSWGQYGTHVEGCGQGGIFVHSVAGATRSVYNLSVGEYMKLGNPASHGCIRVCVADAKWVYYNCNGATIRIFDGKYNKNETFKGPLGRKPITPLRGSKNFDPTDPAVP